MPGYPCAVEINDQNWNEVQAFYLAAISDSKTDGTQERHVTLSLYKMYGGSTSKTQEERCQIQVMDSDTRGQCKSNNDPHFCTFDGM